MPGGDRTGPLGGGPGTGRGMGVCGGYIRPGLAYPAFGFRGGFGFGRGNAGFGWRNRFYAAGIPGWAPLTPEQELDGLKAQAEALRSQLEAIQKRMDELTEK